MASSNQAQLFDMTPEKPDTSGYSAKDIEKMTTDEGRVTADCQFCGAHYDLDPKSVGFEAETASDA